MRRCESCGRRADVILRDDSTWCMDCHAAALRLGYDRQLGRTTFAPRSWQLRFVRYSVGLVALLCMMWAVLALSSTGGWLRFTCGLIVLLVAVPILRKECR